MNYKIIGDSDAPIVDITLSSGETIKVERGAMAFMQNVSLQAETNSKKSGFGGLVGALARSAVRACSSQKQSVRRKVPGWASHRQYREKWHAST